MDPYSSYVPAAPSDDQIARLTQRLLDLCDRMTDDQILDVASALQQRLRGRLDLRGRSHRRGDDRLHHGRLDMMI